MRAQLTIAMLCLCAVVPACGGHSISTGQLRFLAVSPDAPAVNLVVDQKTVASNLAYNNNSDYLATATGSRRVRAVPVNGGAAILDTTVPVTQGTYQTLLLTGPAAHAQSVVLSDGGTTASSGNGNVRIVNASQAMGPSDVYLVPAGTGLGTVQPVAVSVGFDKNTGYQLVAAGSYEVFMTAPGTKNVFLATGPINLTASQNQTLVALDAIPGGFTFTSLTDQ